MEIPKYVPIGFSKGFSIEQNDWIYGYHWVETPYVCFSTDNVRPKHFIRVQNNYDWNLTGQDDIEVHPESVGHYIAKMDKNGIPLFLQDIITDGEKEGIIVYDVLESAYRFKVGNDVFPMPQEVEFLNTSYNKNKPKVHTVELHFRPECHLDIDRILVGINEYKDFFGKPPKTIKITEEQYIDLKNNGKLDDIIRILKNEYECTLKILELED